MPNSKKIFFPNLDGLRFIAFSMVFLGHMQGGPFRVAEVQNIYLQKALLLFTNGKTGVSIFFVLSGFLITYLILSEIKLNGKLDVIKFYIRRSLRIWPLYFLILLLIFGIFPLLMNAFHENWSQYDMQPWYYFVFLSNFDVLHIYLNNGKDILASTLTWSVAIEEQFYLVWPLLFLALKSHFYKFIFPACIAICYAFRYYHADNSSILYYHTISVFGDLALGGWVAYLSLTNEKFKDFFINQSYPQRVITYLAGGLLLYALQFGHSLVFNVFGRLIQTLFFSYVIMDQNFNLQPNWKLSNNKLFTFWGKYTYGLYLWHAFLLMIVNIIGAKLLHFSLDSMTVRIVLAVVGFLVSLTVSYCSYHWYEAWFLKLKDKFSFIHKD